MNRRFGSVMLVIIGMALGSMLGPFSGTHAAAPPAQEAGEDELIPDLAGQLRDIRTQVKEINTLLHSGTVKVVVVLNPDEQ